jgi:hypothetical protein
MQINTIGKSSTVKKIKVGDALIGGKVVDIYLAQPSGSPIINTDDRWYIVDMESIVQEVIDFDQKGRKKKVSKKRKTKK